MLLLSGCAAGDPEPEPSPASTPAPVGSEAVGEKPPNKSGGRDDAVAPLEQVAVALKPFVKLAAPTAMAIRPGDDALYFAERGGVVRAVRNGRVDGEPVLDLSGNVSTGGEQGLLGLTFSAEGDELYVSYTNEDGNSRLDAYPMRGDRPVVDERRELLAVAQPYANHNGGNVVLGPDSMLYLGLGDGGSAGDPDGNAQNPETLLGKMVRIDPTTGKAPPDNPFVGEEGFQPEIFALGLRNPWRFSFDRKTADLWVGDVGQNTLEEISMTRAGKSAGRNFGWDLYEGSQPYEGGDAPRGNVLPVLEYRTGEEGCSVTGGFVYRGEAIPGLRGAYVYSDYCGGWIRALRSSDGKITDRADFGLEASEVASFGQDADGELYVLSLGGQVWRLVGK